MKYVVAMNRDRDSYQVPAALAEEELLSEFVTDYYHGASALRIASLAHRQSELIAPGLVRPVAAALGYQTAHRLMNKMPGLRAPFPSRKIDHSIATGALKASLDNPKAGLLLYANYAYRAFEEARAPLNALFQYHPSASAIRMGLETDDRPRGRGWEVEPELADTYRQEIYAREIGAADRLLCASQFTANGLVADGVDAARITVVPYGCPERQPATQLKRERTVLFVGQGVQRKGLHILLRAWRITPHLGWKLRIVASRLDDSMREELAAAADSSVEFSGSISADELRHLYATSDTLVLPSLVEGFGLVLGEALASGCRLVASTNTGLPDLNLPHNVGRVVEPGSVSSMSTALADLFSSHSPYADHHDEAIECARIRSWASYRRSVRAAVNSWGENFRGNRS